MSECNRLTSASDPVLRAYMALSGEQVNADAHLLQGLSADSIERARDLVGDLEVDPDEDLGEVDLPTTGREPM